MRTVYGAVVLGAAVTTLTSCVCIDLSSIQRFACDSGVCADGGTEVDGGTVTKDDDGGISEVDAGSRHDAGAADSGVSPPDASAADSGLIAPDAGPASIALAEFCAKYPEKACQHLAGCGLYESANSTSCLAMQSLSVACAKAAAGAYEYDSVLAQACLDELGAATTTCFSNWSACLQLYNPSTVPGVGFGGVFTARAYACRNTVCDAGRCDQLCSGASCQPFREVGQSCNEGFSGPFAYCNPATAWCRVDTCQALARVGDDCRAAPCEPGSYCEYPVAGQFACQATRADNVSCDKSAQCSSGLCRPTDSKCGPLALGAPCAAASDCGNYSSPNICLGLVLADAGVTLGRCAPRRVLGETCNDDWGAPADPCAGGTAACLGGRCVSLASFSLPMGAECPLLPSFEYELAPAYGVAACQRGLTCLTTSGSAAKKGLCLPPLAAGTPCREDFWCATGLQCLGVSDGGRECGALPVRGQPCPSALCRRDSTCAYGVGTTCQPLLQLDAGCAAIGSHCDVGLSCDGTKCVAPRPGGASCQFDFDCASNACERNLCVDVCLR